MITKSKLGLLAALLSAVPLGTSGCLDAPEYVYGTDLTEVRLVLYRLDMGVHPSKSVLNDPNNPFRFDGLGDEMRFTLLTYANASAAFYGWATSLANIPTGESQYYAALSLQGVYENEEVSDVELPFVRQMALDGYEALLRDFPESVSFDPTGKFPFRLAPLAYQGILDLGGIPPTGWEVVDGVVVSVPNDGQNAPEVP